jgi:AraC-like DNA-binding protein
MSRYRELPASRDLYSLVACRWVRRAPVDAGNGSTLVLPDGCVDLIWRNGELMLAGPDRTAHPSPVRPGETILGLRMRPGVAGAVLGLPASEVLDGRHPLEDVMGQRVGVLRELLGEASAEDEAFALLEGLVSSQVHDSGPDPLVLAATRRLGFPGSRVEELADALGISDRQLRRRFHDAVGYGPKTLDRVLRFRRLVSQAPAVAAGDGDLARIAADLGYADQAHMTRDCVRLSGLPPARLAALWAS